MAEIEAEAETETSVPMVRATAISEPLAASIATSSIATSIATPVTESVASAVVQPPTTVRVISPLTLPEGATFRAVVDGIEFLARVPPGGVREGETFETLYPKTVRVRAPATLATGDRFEAEVDGHRFLATVPVGGVRAGDVFETPQTPIAAVNRWRTGLCDCCDSSRRDCCLLCCVGTFCNIVLHAQIMQRMNLNVVGCRRYNNNKPGTCPLLLSITAGLFGLLVLVVILQSAVGMVLVYLSLLGWFFVLFVAMVCTRKSMRTAYDLPGACCTDCDCCDDCCVTYWCSCCSAIQMATHTHDPRIYPYECCSGTGLSPRAPPCGIV